MLNWRGTMRTRATQRATGSEGVLREGETVFPREAHQLVIQYHMVIPENINTLTSYRLSNTFGKIHTFIHTHIHGTTITGKKRL